MGLTWCRERVEQAKNSKNPVDRILVCCSNAIKPKAPYSHSQGKIVNDFVYRGMRNKNLGISAPVPIHAVPPRARNRIPKTSDWHTCTLIVPGSDDPSKPPVPPPRKKRRRKINSAEVLNSQLPELKSPGYVIFSENLLNQKFSNANTAQDVLRPLQKTYTKERTSGRYRVRKNKEFYIGDGKEKKIKNDNEKKSEEKIKHVSTVSLPNYNELVKPSRKVSTEPENGDDKTGNQSGGCKPPQRNSSSISLPGEGSNSILGSLSEATIHRLEMYMKKCRSFGSLKPQQLLEKLEEFNKTQRSGSESSDSWSGLDDWDLGVIEYCDPETSDAPPPKSIIPSKHVSFNSGSDYSKSKKEEQPTEAVQEEPSEAVVEEKPEVTKPPGKPLKMQRKESVIEGIPLEWFLDSQLRPPAIMPPPMPEVTDVKTPPPSPEGTADPLKDQQLDTEVHSSLLDMLRKYKEEETGKPEVKVDVEEIIEAKDEITFDEIDLEIPIREDFNRLLPLKNRSNSLTVEQAQAARALRSPSFAFEKPSQLLEELRKNSDEIEKEILFKPKALIQELRRESLCLSLPEDAFEAFENKKNPSIREFLGFGDEKLGSSAAKGALLGEGKDEEKDLPPIPPPLPSSPPPVNSNSRQGDENTQSSTSSQIQ